MYIYIYHVRGQLYVCFVDYAGIYLLHVIYNYVLVYYSNYYSYTEKYEFSLLRLLVFISGVKSELIMQTAICNRKSNNKILPKNVQNLIL